MSVLKNQLHKGLPHNRVPRSKVRKHVHMSMVETCGAASTPSPEERVSNLKCGVNGKVRISYFHHEIVNGRYKFKAIDWVYLGILHSVLLKEMWQVWLTTEKPIA